MKKLLQDKNIVFTKEQILLLKSNLHKVHWKDYEDQQAEETLAIDSITILEILGLQ